MQISNKTIAEKFPIEVDAWKLLEGSKVMVISMLIKPGQAVEKHNNELDVLFIMQYGECTLLYKDEEHVVKAGDCICVESGSERGWFNHSDNVAEIVVVKVKKQ